MKKRIIAVLCCFVLLQTLMLSLTSCSGDDIPDGYQLVVCEGDKFRLYVPASWISNHESGITGAYSSVDENASVCVFVADTDKTTLADYWNECEENYRDSFTDLEITDKDEKASLGGKKALSVKFSATRKITSQDTPDGVDKAEDVKYKYLQIMAIYEDDIYVLLFGADHESFDKHISTVEGADNDDGEFAGIIPYFAFSDEYYSDDEKKFSDKVECPDGMQLVSTDKRPYRFFVPTSWQPDYRSSISGAYYSDSDRSNVSLQGHMLGIDDMSLEDYLKQNESKYRELYGEGYELIECDKEAFMGDQKSYKCVFKVVSGGNTYKVLQSFCVKGAMAYVFTYTSTLESFELHLSDVDMMLDAFEIR